MARESHPVFAEWGLRWAPYATDAANRAYRKASGIRRQGRLTIRVASDDPEAVRALYGERNPDASGPERPDPGDVRRALPAPEGELGELLGGNAGWDPDARGRQCAFCGRGVRGTPWLCQRCESKLGAMCAADLCQALGLQRLEDATQRPNALTTKGRKATPAELATGNLGLYQLRWWPEWAKALVSDERKRRRQWATRHLAPERQAALADAVATEQPVSAEQAVEDAAPLDAELTPEEARVVAMRAAGYTNAEIAEALGHSERTAKRRVAAVREKLDG